MPRYHRNNYINLLNALTDAANWEQFATKEEYSTVVYSDLKALCVERCLEKHANVVDELKYQIEEIHGEMVDEENYAQKNIHKLEREINTLVDIINTRTFPSNTLIDVEKIEIIKENWDKLTYDNLKTIITKEPDNIIIQKLQIELYNLKSEFLDLQDEYMDYIDEHEQ